MNLNSLNRENTAFTFFKVLLRWILAILIFFVGNIILYVADNITLFIANDWIITLLEGVTLRYALLVFIFFLLQAILISDEEMIACIDSLEEGYKAFIGVSNLIIILVFVGEINSAISFFNNTFSTVIYLFTLLFLVIFEIEIIVRRIPSILVQDFLIFRFRRREKGLGKITKVIKFFNTIDDDEYINIIISANNLIKGYLLIIMAIIVVYLIVPSPHLTQVLLLTSGIAIWSFLIQRIKKLSTIESLEIITQIIVVFLAMYMFFAYIMILPLASNLTENMLSFYNIKMEKFLFDIEATAIGTILSVCLILLMTYVTYFRIYARLNELYIYPHLTETTMNILEKREFEISKHKIERYWNLLVSLLSAILFTILGLAIGVLLQ